jgi:hypothetical protein
MTQLAPGAGCEVTAAFIPRTAGVRSAGLRIEVNAAGGPLLVPLTGVAVDPGPGRLNLDPEFVLFEEQPVGTTSTPKEVMVRNAGGRPVSVRYFQRDGHRQDFAVDSTRCPTQLTPGATCPLAVTFTPTAAGARGASLVAVSDAADDRVAAQLAGSGQGGGPGRLRADPSFLNFTGHEVGSKSEPRAVTIANVGESPVTIRGVRRAGNHATDFAVDGSDCQNATVGAGKHCMIKVTFTPGAEGPRNADVVISSNAVESETTVPLHGLPPNPVLRIVPDSLDFGARPIGKPTAPERLFVQNNGSTPVTVGSIEVLGQAAADFVVDSKACLRKVLSPDQSCELAVAFAPGANGGRSARVVANSDPLGSSAEAALGGTGRLLKKELTVTPEAISFEGPAGKPTDPKFVHVDNTGTDPVTLGQVLVAPPGAFAVSNGTCPSPPHLPPGHSCDLAVTFAPAAPGTEYTATLEVHSDVTGPAATVKLMGSSSKEPKLEVTPSGLTLDNDKNPSGIVRVKSVGGKPATIGKVAVVPAGNFEVDDRPCSGQSLEPNDFCEMTVTFTPSTENIMDLAAEATVHRAELQIPSDASPRSSVVALTGTVLRPERALLVEPTLLDFDAQAVGTESPRQFVEVRNIGGEPVTIIGADRGGDDADAFTVQDAACRRIPLKPATTCTVAVTFTPGTANRAYEAEFTVVAETDGDKTVKLTGKSQADQPDLVPAKTYQLSLEQHTFTITVANRGGAAAGPTSARLDAPGHDPQSRDLVALPPRTSSEISFVLPLACSDRCELTVTVDDAERVREANERNNRWTYLIDAAAAQAARRNQVR